MIPRRPAPAGFNRLNIDGRFLLQDVTGVQRVAIEFVRALDDMLIEGELPGLEVVVLVPGRGQFVTTPDYQVVEVRRSGRLGSHAWEQLELPGLARSGPLLCLGNLAPMASLLSRRTPVFTMVHDLSYVYYPLAYSRRFRFAYRALMPVVLARSRRVFTVSNAERSAILDRYANIISHDRLVAVQNGGGEGALDARITNDPGVLESSATEIPSQSLRSKQGLYVGSLTRRKNAANLIRAAEELVRTSDVDFVFVGSTGASFEETGVSLSADVEGRIHFLGQINDPELIEAEYRRASVFLFPSHYEASPLPPVEAMRWGCPVVAADIPSLRERCGDAVVYCDPSDIGSIVRQAQAVLERPDEWRQLQLSGLTQAAKYSWRKQVRTVLEHVNQD